MQAPFSKPPSQKKKIQRSWLEGHCFQSRLARHEKSCAQSNNCAELSNWPDGQRDAFSAKIRASGSIPYKASAGWNTEENKVLAALLWVSKLPATFAQIPTWGGQIASRSTEMDVSPNRGELRSNSSDARRFSSRVHGGIG